jgi:N-carbamoyl-L-amino-acid hydrolase
MNIENVIDNFQTFNNFARNRRMVVSTELLFSHPERVSST